MNTNQWRNDFPILQTDLNKQPIVYFDNGATTLKPQIVIDAILNYYSKYTANVHRGDFDFSIKASNAYEQSRMDIAQFINAESNEIIFTPGTTNSANMISEWMGTILRPGDEILLNHAEHASNLLPWFQLAKKYDLKIVYSDLNADFTLNIVDLKKKTSNKTKIISFALVTNVIGDTRDAQIICAWAHAKKIITIIDAAQAVAHQVIDVKKINCDFLYFGAHKIYGPTGIGILYGKNVLLKNMPLAFVGGGMNQNFNEDMILEPKLPPYCFEAGTPNIAGVIGFGAAINYISKIGINLINQHELALKKYAIKKLSTLDKLIIYNANIKSPSVVFNFKGIFCQDVASYLNTKKIAVRAGNHCAKILLNKLGTIGTIRIVFGLYNTKKEIDYLYAVLKDKKAEDLLNIFFE